MNILVVCAAGMTSSALVANMRIYAGNHPELEYKIGSCASNQTDIYCPRADVVLIAPQLVYEEERLREKFPDQRFIVIPPAIYGELDGSAVLGLIEKPEERKNRIPSWVLKLTAFIAHSSLLQALSQAMMSLFPVLMIGSILTLLRFFPNQMYLDVLETSRFTEILDLGISVTTGSISMYAVFLTAYRYAKAQDLHPAGAGVNALICFLLLIQKEKGLIDTEYLDASGMFLAFLTAFLSVRCYRRFYHTMVKYAPEIDQLPENILGSFLSILPVFYSLTVFLIINCLSVYFGRGNLPELVYIHIQRRLQLYIGDTLVSGLLSSFIVHFLWFFGIHGGQIVGTITGPVLRPLSMENLAAYQAGLPLPHIFSQQFSSVMIFGGAGSTLSLCILMSLFSRSQKMRRLGRLSLPMGIFGINEPLIFGIPIMLNPIMLVPFVLIPVASTLLTYILTVQEILPRVIGLEIPWTTPPLISGIIEGGWRTAAWQGILLLLQGVMWYPFFTIMDRQFLDEEKKDRKYPGV